MLPPAVESSLPAPAKKVLVGEVIRKETLTTTSAAEFAETIGKVRTMINIAMGTLKELKAQAVEKYNAPGMRFLIGEILSCLGHAYKATGVNPSDLNFTQLTTV